MIFFNTDMYYGQCLTATRSSCSPTEDNCTDRVLRLHQITDLKWICEILSTGITCVCCRRPSLFITSQLMYSFGIKKDIGKKL